MEKILLKFINLYKSSSRSIWALRPLPIFYSTCKFYPTCSDYADEVIHKYGAKKGTAKAALRILKCNPFHKGGYDPA